MSKKIGLYINIPSTFSKSVYSFKQALRKQFLVVVILFNSKPFRGRRSEFLEVLGYASRFGIPAGAFRHSVEPSTEVPLVEWTFSLLPFFSKNQLKKNSGVQFLSDTARGRHYKKTQKGSTRKPRGTTYFIRIEYTEKFYQKFQK